MADRQAPAAVEAASVPARTGSSYPEPFASRMAGRAKRALGDVFGLSTFGVNRTTLAPGAVSALRHAHSRQDEFVYVLEGTPTLVDDHGRTPLRPGMCVGFRAGNGNAHQLVNDGDLDAVYLEVGGRDAGDEVAYPDDDIAAVFEGGRWHFRHRDGTPY
jgi:uncharacterized cupin superfamily protein